MNTLLTTASATRPALASLLRWQEPLATRLRFRHALPGMVANRLLNVELGLYLLAELVPMAPPQSLSDLLNGQGFVYRQRPIWSPRQHRALNQARILLAPYLDRNAWLKALDKYENLPADLRIFNLNGNLRTDLSGYLLRERVGLFSKALA
ncbi:MULTISPECIES: hypothetical protein [Spirosoma]|uniref:pPIWI_RE_Z domain-containing protein n=1 Tax=Spirosoma TaxID=107 RepID=UPI000959C2E1|nr:MULTISPECIES: hypothetical protein [Spirosoma]MBN8822193.1 hypothetical protein [Spirosoma sp.]OJW72487.1 MAG: hypothetical protein BGO59_15280 [Spirosoma sp. 48-14]